MRTHLAPKPSARRGFVDDAWRRLVFALLCAIAPLASMANNWTVRGVPVEVSRCPKGYCLVSTPCVSGAQPNCRALEVMNNRVVADSGPGGTNPGSGVCQTKLNGSVFVAKDSSGNEVAFCRFADGSFLSLDGLWRW